MSSTTLGPRTSPCSSLCRTESSEPEQAAFIPRVRGGWGGGAFTGSFREPSQLPLGVVRALSSYRDEQRAGDATPAAQQRAMNLAVDDGRSRGSGGAFVRVVLVPVCGATVIDFVVIEHERVIKRVARIVRDHDLVPHTVGIDVRATSAGVTLSTPSSWDHAVTVLFASDGAVVADLAVRGDGTMGGMVVSYPKVQQQIAAACGAGQAPWAMVPSSERIRQVAATVAVPESSSSPLSLSGQTSGSMRMVGVGWLSATARRRSVSATPMSARRTTSSGLGATTGPENIGNQLSSGYSPRSTSAPFR